MEIVPHSQNTLMFLDCVTTTLQVVKPFSESSSSPVTFEVSEFVPPEGECSNPYTEYINTLYVYPRNLKYDAQKIFAKVFYY